MRLLVLFVALAGFLSLAGISSAAPVKPGLYAGGTQATQVDYYWNRRHWKHRRWEHRRWHYYN
jgi:hypothetical protein